MGSSKIPRPSESAELQANVKLAVAFSGGLDSTVLLHSTVAAYGPEQVIALHVNHGLQDLADDWVVHCAAIAQSFEVAFDFRLLNWPQAVDQLNNIEAQARDSRYVALAQMCEHHGVTHLLLGHHQDDQAETILLQLLRGSGLPGLSGMPSKRMIPATHLEVWRPFIDLTRSELEAYAREYQLEWIEDPSNANEQFNRNWIRRKIVPLLEHIQPQFRGTFSRSAAHLASAQHLLDQLADLDLETMCKVVGGAVSPIDVQVMRRVWQKDHARGANVLRRWLFLQGVSMPSEERLNAWWQDLEKLQDSTDHQLQWMHDGKVLRVWRQSLRISDPSIAIGHWEMRVVAQDSDELGLSQEVYELAIAQGSLQEKERTGGEKIRTHPSRPRKFLKHLFQEMDIPPWHRGAKILCLGPEVLAVVGIGVHCDVLTAYGPRLVPVFIQDLSDA